MKIRSTIRTEVNGLYRRKFISWLTAHVKDQQDPPNEFPVALYLSAPADDKELKGQEAAFKRFIDDWKQPLISGHVEWVKKSYQGLGTLDVPLQIIFDTPLEVAKWSGNLIEYQSALERLDVIARELPDLVDSALNVISSISNLESADFTRFVAVCKWLLEHKNSKSLIRAIPVRGVDTRWFEINRHLIFDFLREALDLSPVRKDLIQLGLVPPPKLITLRILDHVLRTKAGGMSCFAATKADLERLNLKPQRVIFMDNLPTAMSIPDMPGTVIVLADDDAEVACAVSWVGNARCQYLGSIELNSFARLHNLRCYLPRLEALLLDEKTLVDNRDLCTFDDVLGFSGTLSTLNEEEALFYQDLSLGVFGSGVRLALERLPLELVLKALGCKESAEPLA